MSQEKLLSPKELGGLVGLRTAQFYALMNDGRLEFVEITPNFANKNRETMATLEKETARRAKTVKPSTEKHQTRSE